MSPAEEQVSPGRLVAAGDTVSVDRDARGVTCSLDMEMGKIASGEQNTPSINGWLERQGMAGVWEMLRESKDRPGDPAL